jgi:hypothetical protein
MALLPPDDDVSPAGALIEVPRCRANTGEREVVPALVEPLR